MTYSEIVKGNKLSKNFIFLYLKVLNMLHKKIYEFSIKPLKNKMKRFVLFPKKHISQTTESRIFDEHFFGPLFPFFS